MGIGRALSTGLAIALAVNPVLATAASPAAPGSVPATTGLERLEREVKSFTLANGLRFILVERHDAPVFSFQTVVDAGSADDEPGATGLAHMMEHMAFKGTPWVGTRDAAAEPPLLAAEEHAYAALAAERGKPVPDSTRVGALANAFASAQAAAEALVEPEEFVRLLEQSGAKDINASTSSDVTAYFYSIPSNRLELWAVMEGGRLAHPVFREFYRERDVVMEERRESTESSPFGRLADAFVRTAFTVHPYGYGTIGAAADLASLTRTEGEAFFRRHYVASAITIAVVGDVTLAELRSLSQRYFIDVPTGPPTPPVAAVEPEQRAERRVTMDDRAQSVVMMGWHVPACTDPRYPAYEALADLLGGGDHARLQKRLVADLALSVSEETTVGFPGAKYPCLWGLISVPAEGVAPDSVERAVENVLDDARRAHPFTQAELDGYKVRVRAQKLAAVEGNLALANELSMAQALRGDWRQFFRGQDRVQALTLADLNAALATFTVPNRTTAVLVHRPDPAAEGH